MNATRLEALRALAAALVLGAGFALAPSSLGCSFDEGANPQHGCGACPIGQCVNGFCLTAQDQSPVNGGGAASSGSSGTPVVGGASGGSGDGTVSGSGATGGSAAGSSGSGSGGSSGSAGSAPSLPCAPNSVCYSADAATMNVGVCRPGECDPTGTCLGEVGPSPEACNQLDDDCDNELDEDLGMQSCTPTGSSGACAGGVMQCMGGMSVCVAAEPAAESCNGVDDDCDGMVDDGLDIGCYPAGMVGCSEDGAGGFSCRGRCAAGKRTCSAGALSDCSGATTPAAESCGDDEAGDEDCDGRVDEGCACSGSDTQRCYSGPLLAPAGFGTCRSGVQRCVDGKWGSSCEGEVLPVPETCANNGADNNCNLVLDDIPNLETNCTRNANLGVCRSGMRRCQGGALVCVTPTAQSTETQCDGRDEDCDGRVDEVFMFATDERHCGSCTTTCEAGQLCCGGGCVTTASDANNCGGCGVRCGANRTCCGGQCVETNSDLHCGGCGGCNTGAGLHCCGAQCVVPNTNAACGASCSVCDTGAGQQCCGGRCQVPNTNAACGAGCDVCDTGAGQQCCGGRCQVPNTNAACGASCDVCEGNEQCCGGRCRVPNTADACGTDCEVCSAPGTTCCGGDCIVPNRKDACGPSCMACPGDQQCCAGSCVDTNDNSHCGGCNPCDTSMGYSCCGTDCFKLKEDENHCGACNAAPCATLCCEGMCLADPLSNNDHCGTCGNKCGEGCACSEGKCKTPEGLECQ